MMSPLTSLVKRTLEYEQCQVAYSFLGDCCESHGYDATFSDRFARRMARRYRRRGLSRSARAIVAFLTDRGIDGASILEIGGGVGSSTLGAAASRADRLLVFSHLPRNLVTRTMFSAENGMRRLKGDTFRAFIRPPAAMRNVAAQSGLRGTYRWRGFSWCVVGFER